MRLCFVASTDDSAKVEDHLSLAHNILECDERDNTTSPVSSKLNELNNRWKVTIISIKKKNFNSQ